MGFHYGNVWSSNDAPRLDGDRQMAHIRLELQNRKPGAEWSGAVNAASFTTGHKNEERDRAAAYADLQQKRDRWAAYDDYADREWRIVDPDEAALQAEQNLTDALAVFGITHKPSKVEGKRDWYSPDGAFFGSYDAHDGWALVRDWNSAEGAGSERYATSNGFDR
jgi:hypothetical protein